MSDESKMYRLCFLVYRKSWEDVKKVFREDLGLTKDKKDDSVIPIREHFVVEINLTQKELDQAFYEKVAASKSITIISDEYSQENAREVAKDIADVELRLREFATYAYDLAATYKEIISAKRKEAKELISKDRLVGSDMYDPLLAFFDFGELINFLGKTGNIVDESNLADDMARLMESSSNFDEFKTKYSQKFKKLTVWEIISSAVLVSSVEWEDMRRDLETLKDIRNTALHYRILTPEKTQEAKKITSKLAKQLKTKTPKQNQTENMQAIFESWNTALKGYENYQKTLEVALNPTARTYQRILESQMETPLQTMQKAYESIARMNDAAHLKPFQKTLENIHKIPDTQLSALESLSKSLNSMNGLGLASWVADESNQDDEKNRDKDSRNEQDETSSDIRDKKDKE